MNLQIQINLNDLPELSFIALLVAIVVVFVVLCLFLRWFITKLLSGSSNFIKRINGIFQFMIKEAKGEYGPAGRANIYLTCLTTTIVLLLICDKVIIRLISRLFSNDGVYNIILVFAPFFVFLLSYFIIIRDERKEQVLMKIRNAIHKN